MSKGFEPLYTVEEAAEILKLKPKTLANKMSARQITYYEGRPALIPESAIKEFLNKRKKRALV